MDPHTWLCFAEHYKPTPRRCIDCGGEAEGNYSAKDDSGEWCPVCDACDALMMQCTED